MARGDEPAAVGTECHAVDPTGVPFSARWSRPVAASQSMIVLSLGTRCDRLTVRTERQIEHIRMACERRQELIGLDVPEPDAAIDADRGDGPAVGAVRRDTRRLEARDR